MQKTPRWTKGTEHQEIRAKDFIEHGRIQNWREQIQNFSGSSRLEFLGNRRQILSGQRQQWILHKGGSQQSNQLEYREINLCRGCVLLSGYLLMDYQQTLGAVGVPVSLAEKCSLILEKQRQNPFYQRTQEEQELINHSHTWWVAQGMKSVQNDGNY